ncbi:MAG: hypothetical protein HY763_06285 [Planctomycetes bacterium]|nr:hypothetical protein [Planctomycetota bacterium]
MKHHYQSLRSAALLLLGAGLFSGAGCLPKNFLSDLAGTTAQGLLEFVLLDQVLGAATDATTDTTNTTNTTNTP